MCRCNGICIETNYTVTGVWDPYGMVTPRGLTVLDQTSMKLNHLHLKTYHLIYVICKRDIGLQQQKHQTGSGLVVEPLLHALAHLKPRTMWIPLKADMIRRIGKLGSGNRHARRLSMQKSWMLPLCSVVSSTWITDFKLAWIIARGNCLIETGYWVPQSSA